MGVLPVSLNKLFGFTLSLMLKICQGEAGHSLSLVTPSRRLLQKLGSGLLASDGFSSHTLGLGSAAPAPRSAEGSSLSPPL